MDEVEPITYFTEPALLWLAGTVMGDDRCPIHIWQSKHYCGWMSRLSARSGSGSITYFTEPALLWLTVTIMSEEGPITYLTEPALLWLAGTVMSEVAANNTFHGISITMVGWHDYGRGRGP